MSNSLKGTHTYIQKDNHTDKKYCYTDQYYHMQTYTVYNAIPFHVRHISYAYTGVGIFEKY